MGIYIVIVNTDDLKRSDEAIKIEFVARTERLKGLGLPSFDSPEAMMADLVHGYVAELVAEKFTARRLERIAAALPSATDQEIDNVARDLGLDLDIDVPVIPVKP